MDFSVYMSETAILALLAIIAVVLVVREAAALYYESRLIQAEAEYDAAYELYDHERVDRIEDRLESLEDRYEDERYEQ